MILCGSLWLIYRSLSQMLKYLLAYFQVISQLIDRLQPSESNSQLMRDLWGVCSRPPAGELLLCIQKRCFCLFVCFWCVCGGRNQEPILADRPKVGFLWLPVSPNLQKCSKLSVWGWGNQIPSQISFSSPSSQLGLQKKRSSKALLLSLSIWKGGWERNELSLLLFCNAEIKGMASVPAQPGVPSCNFTV